MTFGFDSPWPSGAGMMSGALKIFVDRIEDYLAEAPEEVFEEAMRNEKLNQLLAEAKDKATGSYQQQMYSLRTLGDAIAIEAIEAEKLGLVALVARWRADCRDIWV